MLALVLSGCAARVVRDPVPIQLVDQVGIPGMAHARFWGDEVPANIVGFMREHMPGSARMASKVDPRAGQPLVEYLALSGGAGDGAFGGGVLVGWTQRGDRPHFEVVTGVSAGALIAPFAFLGPAYDRQLKEMWTKYDTNMLVTPQVLAGLLGAEALTDNSGLRDLIAKYVDRRLLNRVADEYRKGRVLLIGTTNLDAQRPVIWNMGEIAANRHPYALELFRDVLLASTAVPGAFPPVHIKVANGDRVLEEMHVDGGPTRQVFLAPAHLSLRTFDALYAKPPQRRIYVIKNGKLTPEYEAVQANTLAISARSLFTLTKSQSIGDINRIYQTAQRDKAQFRLTSIPSSFDMQAKQAFDPEYMKALFDVGYELGRSGGAWSTSPPEAARGSAQR
ncbi:MAG: patatin-like phospholipase family protein [Hyphomicrobiaceae bacterium]|nr:patatin-like phospholipase family protein [Hyphomicrobiaceae bacterium]